MTIRSKWQVQKVERAIGSVPYADTEGKITWGPGENITVEMWPVTANNDPDHENFKFWKATPAGQLRMTFYNPEIAAQLEPGKFYYLDMTPAD